MMLYTAGRFWIEALRIDTVNEIGGFRLNNYTSVIVFVAALIWFALVDQEPARPRGRRRGRPRCRSLSLSKGSLSKGSLSKGLSLSKGQEKAQEQDSTGPSDELREPESNKLREPKT